MSVSLVYWVSCEEFCRHVDVVPVYLGGVVAGPLRAVALERVVEAGVSGLPVAIVITRLQLALVKALDALLASGLRGDAVRVVVDTVCELSEDQEQCRAELGPIVEEIVSTTDPSKINELVKKAIELVR